MKTVLFVPGFQEDINSRNYKKTIAAIEKAGYQVRFVAINWSRTTIYDWVRELEEVYSAYDPKSTVLAGFSFGAMTAFMMSVKRSPSELWLYSLSPYFSEDLVNPGFRSSWLRVIGSRREKTFRELNFSELIHKITSHMVFFYGETELKTWSDISYRHKILESVPRAEEILIPNGKHDVTSDEYINAIEKL